MPETKSYVTLGHFYKESHTRIRRRAVPPQKLLAVMRPSERVGDKFVPTIMVRFVRGRFSVVKRDDGKFEFTDSGGHRRVVEFDACAALEANPDFGRTFAAEATGADGEARRADEGWHAEPDGRLRLAKQVRHAPPKTE
jgi:hypothetical protein